MPQKSVDAYNKVDELLWGLRAQEQERVEERLKELQEKEFNAVDEEMDRLDNEVKGPRPFGSKLVFLGPLVGAEALKLLYGPLEHAPIMGADRARNREAVLPAVTQGEVGVLLRVGHAHPAYEYAPTVC